MKGYQYQRTQAKYELCSCLGFFTDALIPIDIQVQGKHKKWLKPKNIKAYFVERVGVK